MKKPAILFMVPVIIAFGCGDGNGDKADAEFDPEKACLDSGGTVENMLCCLLTRSFPDLCVQGNCGCAPEHSHEVRVCVCGEGECFNGFSCVHNPWWG